MKKNVFTMGALGDSISIAFNAHDPHANPLLSWSTGSEYGHAGRLAALYPSLEVVHHNVAFNGAKSRDLRAQVDQLLPHAPDYVTLLVGANDLIHGLTSGVRELVESFTAAVEEAISRLVAKSPRVMIVGCGVPNQARLLDLLVPNLDPFFATHLRKLYGERWELFNDALAAITRRYPNNLRFSPAVALAEFEKHHLSAIDSYHPSVEGQRLLADLSWREGWF